MFNFEIHGYIFSMGIPWKFKHTYFEAQQFVLTAVRQLFVHLFGGERCLCCGRESGIVPLCKECIGNFIMNTVSPGTVRCSVCGKILVSEQNKCMACREKPVLLHADASVPLYPYRLWRKELLFEWKMQDKRALSPIFAAAVYKAMCLTAGEKDEKPVVIPVPPRPGKIWNRGWDQIDELCRFLELRYGCTILRLLERTTVVQQKKLDRAQRLEMKGKSYVLNAAGRQMTGRKWAQNGVFLLDDVMTTGVTLESCAALLKEAGASKVTVLTLFIVD